MDYMDYMDYGLGSSWCYPFISFDVLVIFYVFVFFGGNEIAFADMHRGEMASLSVESPRGTWTIIWRDWPTTMHFGSGSKLESRQAAGP